MSTTVTVIKAAELALFAIDAAMAALARAKAAGNAVSTAQAEGRATLTDAEWASIVATDDKPRERLVEAIKNATE